MSNQNQFYTYVYLDPRKSGDFIYQRGIDEIYCFNNEPFYVGKGSNDRIDDHINKALNSDKNKLFYNIIRKIYGDGLEPIRFKVLQNVSEEEAFVEEINLISVIGRRDKKNGSLCNETDGGEGTKGRIIKDFTGQIFGKLTVLSSKGKSKNGSSKWLCGCECGNEKIIIGASLTSKRVNSCGCLRKELLRKNNSKLKTKHGKYGTPIYGVWFDMKQKCYNPNYATYRNNGGSGIIVCERWKTAFENFYEDMGDKPSVKHKLERIDVSRNFEPDNCRWILRKGAVFGK